MNRCYICNKEVHENIDYVAMKDKNGNEGITRSLSKGPDDIQRFMCREHLRMFMLMNEFLNPMMNGMIVLPIEEKK